MYFSRTELVAMTKMAKAMAAADGKLDANEIIIIASELAKYTSDQKIVDEAEEMDASVALSALRAMTIDEKKYVCGFLAAISGSDGNVDSKEVAVWRLVSTLAQFPTMTFIEAVNFWRNH